MSPHRKCLSGNTDTTAFSLNSIKFSDTKKADTFCVDFLAEVISFISGSSIFYLGRTSFPERYVTSILKEFQYFLVLYAPLYTIIVKIQVTS